uniref:Uncharacterized protein n=1 Tax=Oryza meridionalis TaxID=40149 RepID=A0A0E0DMS1_9ORYZ
MCRHQLSTTSPPVTLWLLNEELGSAVRLADIKKLMFHVRALYAPVVQGGEDGHPVELLLELAHLGSFFRALAAFAPSSEQGINFASHLVALGSLAMNRREEKTDVVEDDGAADTSGDVEGDPLAFEQNIPVLDLALVPHEIAKNRHGEDHEELEAAQRKATSSCSRMPTTYKSEPSALSVLPFTGERHEVIGNICEKKDVMVNTVKSIKPFEEDYEQLLKDARDAHQRTSCIINVLAIHPITGERHEVIVDSTNDGDVSTLAEDHFTARVVRRYLRLKGRLGEVTLRMLSKELGGAMRLAGVKKLMFRIRAVRLAVLRRSKAVRMATAAELLPVLAHLGSFFRAPAALATPREHGVKFASHLVALGSSIMNRREEKTATLTMFELAIFALEGLSHSPHRRHDVAEDDGAAVAGGDAGGEALAFEPYVAVPDHRGTHHWLDASINYKCN